MRVRSPRRSSRPVLVVLCGLLTASMLAASAPAGLTQSASPPAADVSASPGVTPAAGDDPAVAPFVPPIGATAPTDDAAIASLARSRTPDFTPDTTAAMVEALARSGIGTYQAPSSTEPEVPVTGPVSPVRLLAEEVHALAVGAWAGTGQTGKDLDYVIPTPRSLRGRVPATSGVLAAYVAAADTPGAAFARALVGPQDLRHPKGVVFPAVVLFLFASDLAAGDTRPSPAGSPALPSGQLLPSASPAALAGQGIALRIVPSVVSDVPTGALSSLCSDASRFINDSIDSLFNALKLATPDNLPGRVLVSIWNWVVDQGAAFVKDLISSVTDVVLATVRSIAATIAGVAESIATLVPYAVKVGVEQGTGTAATFLLQHDSPLAGAFVATVTTGDLPDWPDVLKDCAATAKVDLPDIHPHGAPVTWGPLRGPADPYIYVQSSTSVTDDQGQARWAFQTARDPGQPDGEQLNFLDDMPVSVSRPEIDQARQKLQDALLPWVPKVVRPFVDQLFQPLIKGLQARLQRLLETTGTGTAIIVYHQPPEPTPVPSPTADTSAHWTGRWSSDRYALKGTFTVDWTQTGSHVVGTVAITGTPCLPGGAVTGTIKGTSVSFGVVKGRRTVSWQGTIKGRSMSGTYVLEDPTPRCADNGTWSARR